MASLGAQTFEPKDLIMTDTNDELPGRRRPVYPYATSDTVGAERYNELCDKAAIELIRTQDAVDGLRAEAKQSRMESERQVEDFNLEWAKRREAEQEVARLRAEVGRARTASLIDDAAPALVRQLRSERDATLAEIDAAMNVLQPSMPESGIEDACRQRMQAYISERDNAEKFLERLAELTMENDVFRAADYSALNDPAEQMRAACIADVEALRDNWVRLKWNGEARAANDILAVLKLAKLPSQKGNDSE